MNLNSLMQKIKKAAYSILVTFVIVICIFLTNGLLPIELLLYESLPSYMISEKNLATLKFIHTDVYYASVINESNHYQAEDEEVIGVNAAYTVASENDIIGENDILINYKINGDDVETGVEVGVGTDITQKASSVLELNMDFDYLKKNLYICEPDTYMQPDLFNPQNLLSMDMKINQSKDLPKVIIFHTHSQENFKDSDSSNENDGVIGLGKKLADILENEYGLKTIHIIDSFDLIDGKPTNTAYERMEAGIQKIIEENPSLEVAIDIHRDAYNDENFKYVNLVDGKQTAPIMLVNGLSTKYDGKTITPVTSLPNEFQSQNLAFSLKMKLASDEIHPNLMRKLYLKPYRYSLNMLPKSLLVEVGAKSNDMSEVFNAIEPFAEVLASVILSGN